jgi:hypothetical protein
MSSKQLLHKKPPSTKDLFIGAKALKKAVSRHLQLKKQCAPQFTDTALKRRCFIRYTYKGNPLDLKASFTERGFVVTIADVGDIKVVRLTKRFVHRGLVYVARLAIAPSMKRLTLSLSTEPEPAPF